MPPCARSQLKFDPLVLDNGQPRLKLRGTSGTNYTIESSANLTNWALLFSGVATNGALDFLHSAGGDLRQQFYRALASSAPIPPAKTDPRASTNAAAQALAFEDGGSCTLLGNVGQKFILTFPSNAIPNPSLVKMTLVTNIAGLPFSRGIIGAVRLEPEELQIFGAATLEIYFPANIDRQQIVSFTSANDGSDFHLTPDLVRSNHVRIPITHFGTFGSCLATTQEVMQVAQDAQVASGNRNSSQSIASLDLHATEEKFGNQEFQNSSLICFSEKIIRAVAVLDRLKRLRLKNDDDLARTISIERQKQNLGLESDTSELVTKTVGKQCPIYSAELAGYIAEAADNCALTTVLLQFALGVERQLQVIGLADDQGSCTAYRNLAFCSGFKTCLGEIEECCRRSSQGRRSVDDVFKLQRQQRLLGLDCITETDIEGALVTCTNIEWTGTFTYKDHGQTNLISTFGNTTTEHTLSYDLSFAGVVVDSTETIFVDDLTGALTFFVSLIVSGKFDGFTVDKEVYSAPEQCGTFRRVTSYEETIDLSGDYRISFIIDKDSTYRITIPQGFGAASKTLTTGKTAPAQLDGKGNCDGGYGMIYSEPVKSQSIFSAPPLVFPPINEFDDPGAPLGDTDHVKGTFSKDPRPGILPPRMATYHWDFNRRKKQQ